MEAAVQPILIIEEYVSSQRKLKFLNRSKNTKKITITNGQTKVTQ